MSARTRFLVWWGLPILCAGFGALAAAYAGGGSGFGGGPRRGLLMLIGLYFVTVGFLAVIFRVRQSQVIYGDRERFDKPVEAAMVAMCIPVLIGGLWVFATGFLGDFGASQTIRGRLESVDQVGAFGRSYAIDLDKTARPLILECRVRSSCGSPIPLLQLKPGAPTQLEVLRGSILGLTVDGREIVHASGQRAWRLFIGGGALALLVIYTAVFAGVSMRLLFGDPEEELQEDHSAVWGGK